MPLPVVLAAVAVAFSVPILWWVLAAERSRASGARNLALGLAPLTDLRPATVKGSDRVVRPGTGRLAQRARRLTPAGLARSLERRIQLAGSPAGWTVERVLVAKLLLGPAGLLLGFFRVVPATGMLAVLITVILAGVGYFGPDILLQGRGERRQKKIGLELPDTLDQITVSVEAGLGFEAAMAQAGRSGSGPLAEELLRTLQDVQAGMSRSQAMRRLGERTDVPELHHFVLALLQADSYGVPIAQVLRVQAKELRVKRRQRAEERAMKLPVKMLFPLIFCILPSLFIVIMGPGVIRLASSVLSGG